MHVRAQSTHTPIHDRALVAAHVCMILDTFEERLGTFATRESRLNRLLHMLGQTMHVFVEHVPV
jgi:hypothetical protein